MTETTTATAESTEPTPAAVRTWAQSQGLKVGARGRISAEVRTAYDEAHASA